MPSAYLHLGEYYTQVLQPKNAARCYIDALKRGYETENQGLMKEAMRGITFYGLVGYIEGGVISEGDKSPIGVCKSGPEDYMILLLQAYMSGR